MQMKQMSEASVYVLLAWEGEKKEKEQYGNCCMLTAE